MSTIERRPEPARPARRRLSDKYLAAQQAISRELAEALSVDQAMPQVLGTACRALGFDVGILWEAEHRSRALSVRSWWHGPESRLERFCELSRRVTLSSGSGLVGASFASGEAMVVLDVSELRASPRASAALRYGLRTAAAFPVAVGADVLGVVELLGQEVRGHDETLRQLLAVTGQQIGQFLRHVKAEQGLRESEEKHRLLFSSVSEAIVTFDLESRDILDANESAVRLYGYDKETLLTMTLDELFAQGELPARDQAAAVRYQRKKDGAVFPAEVTTAAFRLKDRIVGTSVVRDITQRKQAEEIEKLRQSERMQREFVANVSHEFRTPVAAIKGFAETLLSGGLSDAGNRVKFVGIIEKHAHRLSRLVEEVLDLCALESGRRPPRPQRFTLKTFSNKLGRDLSPLLRRRRLKLVIVVPDRLRVKADLAQMSQVFNNLLSNAIKHSRRGGRISIEAQAQGDRVRVSVRDGGPGIPEGDLSRIFERFNQAGSGSPKKGSGLGLSICRQIVEAHGGRIWAESGKGRGAAFLMTLARAR